MKIKKMKWVGLIIGLFTIMLCLSGCGGGGGGGDSGNASGGTSQNIPGQNHSFTDRTDLANDLVVYINQKRTENGLAALSQDPNVTQVAAEQARRCGLAQQSFMNYAGYTLAERFSNLMGIVATPVIPKASDQASNGEISNIPLSYYANEISVAADNMDDVKSYLFTNVNRINPSNYYLDETGAANMLAYNDGTGNVQNIFMAYLPYFTRVGAAVNLDNTTGKYYVTVTFLTESSQVAIDNTVDTSCQVIEDQISVLVNNVRQQNGRNPYLIPPVTNGSDNILRDNARIKSKHMINNAYFSHNNLTLRDLYTNNGISKYPSWASGTGHLAENLALALTGVEAHNNFVNSPGHLENMLKDGGPNNNFAGIGVVKNGWGLLFVTEHFRYWE